MCNVYKQRQVKSYSEDTRKAEEKESKRLLVVTAKSGHIRPLLMGVMINGIKTTLS